MRERIAFACVIVLTAVGVSTSPGSLPAAESWTNSADNKIVLSLQAGQHDRSDTFVSALIDAGKAQSVFVEYADGTLGRAQLLEPGMLNAVARGSGKKELHFIVPKMARGETARVVAALSDKPVEGRRYVWSGESRQSRRVSCIQCHQGSTMPTAGELRSEWEMLEKTGKVPPLELPKILPTSKGSDFRWHEKLGKNFSSACWECHVRHMLQYEYGQSLAADLAWTPDPPHRTRELPPARSVFHTVFRVRDGRAVSHPLPNGDVSGGRPQSWEIHYGFDKATAATEQYSGIVQQHATTLSEEAGKFIGRHNVRIDWLGTAQGTRRPIAQEERQLTVKDYRGRNRSYAMWIDFVSTLTPTIGAMRLGGERHPGGFRFLPTVDRETTPEYRESATWRAIIFVSEGTTYTAVCFNQSGNPKSAVENLATPGRVQGPSDRSEPVPGVGYGFSADLDPHKPLLVHYRLWIQGGSMPVEEIQSLADDFVEPIEIAVK